MNHSAEILTIGSELLKGSVLNTNAQFLGYELTQLGFRVTHQTSCDDIPTEIDEKLGDAIVRSNVIILSGGLGPTPDDVTRDAIADHFGVPLTFSKSQYAQIEKHYKRRKRKVPKIVRKEAQFPQNAVPLVNHHGIALGFYITYGKRMIIVLPGVPSELRKMFVELVAPLLKKNFKNLKTQHQLSVKTVGISEPDVMRLLQKDFFKDSFQFGIYPSAGEVTLRMQTTKTKTMNSLKAKVKKRLKSHVYAYTETSLVEVVSKLLRKKKKTLAVAESCTGGQLASSIASVPGASHFFKGGITAYSNEVKASILGVDSKVIQKKGAVSVEVAKEMALQVKQLLRASYGVGITGIAGPTGGTRSKPVGTVMISLAGPKDIRVWKHVFWGDREQIQDRAQKKALEYLWKALR